LQRHAYNLFGDPALKIAYARRDLTIRPRFPWQSFGEALAFSGEGPELQAGQRVTVTLFAPIGRGAQSPSGTGDPVERYTRANDQVVAQVPVTAAAQGQFAGELQLPAGLRSGPYRLAALAATGAGTSIAAQVVYLGWPPAGRLLLSPWPWWLGITGALCFGLVRRLRWHRPVLALPASADRVC
jgi:hypothetical protein